MFNYFTLSFETVLDLLVRNFQPLFPLRGSQILFGWLSIASLFKQHLSYLPDTKKIGGSILTNMSFCSTAAGLPGI